MTIASQQDAALVTAMARQAAEDREVIEMCIAAGCTLAEAAAGITSITPPYRAVRVKVTIEEE